MCCASTFRARILFLRHIETVADKNVGSNVDFPPKNAISFCRKLFLANLVCATPQFSLDTLMFMSKRCLS
jgi:hypothetical protein